MIGHLVDEKYQILRLIGQGGMGAVYEGLHMGTGRHVAIKIISQTLEHNQDMVRRFHREARAAGTIDTQHIVQVLDTGIDGILGCPFMVMELLNGQDLSQLIARIGPLPPDLALRIVAQACFGLQKAHESGVVHRDIKPANLFLTRREAGEVIVKVLDFGIAKIKVDEPTGPGAHALTKTGAMLGSPSYMSPEQAKGLKTIDHRSDLWSLGAVLYEALTARTPHHHIETLGQLIIAICGEPPRPVQDFAPWVPPDVAAVAHGALVLDPEGRFRTAQSMLDAMRPLLPQGIAMHEVMLAPMPKEFRTIVQPRLQITATGAPIVTTANRSGVSSAPRKGSKRLWAAVGMSGLALGAAGAVVIAIAQRGPAPAAPTSEPQATPPPPTAPTQVAEQPTASPVPDARKVKVTLVPPPPSAVVVTVDGQPAALDGAEVVVEGTLGSVHTIKVALGKAEKASSMSVDQQVSITDKGALPDTIAIGPLLKGSGLPAPRATAAGTRTVASPPTADPGKKGPAGFSNKDPDL